MKKQIISSVLTTLLSVSSMAIAGGPEVLPPLDYFSGFYIGGTGSVHHNTWDATSSIVLTQPVAPFNFTPITLVEVGELNHFTFSGANFVGYGGVQGGVGKVFRQFLYLGIQGWGEFGRDTSEDSQTAKLPFAPRTVAVPENPVIPAGTYNIFKSATATTNTSARIGNDYGVAAKIGWVVAPQSMFYGKIGASWAQVNLYNSLNVNSQFAAVNASTGAVAIDVNTDYFASSSNSSSKAGLLLGAGFEQFVYEDIISFNLEYDYINYGHVDALPAELVGNTFVTISGTTFGPFVDDDTNVFTTASISSIKVSQLLAGLNFYFGRTWL